MKNEPWHHKKQREAAERVAALMAKPFPDESDDIGCDGTFDPWDIFPAIYGTYDGEFDKCAIEVLIELRDGDKRRDDLGAEMFREMLCTAHLCSYGTSPRVCFPTPELKKLLSELIEKWKAFSQLCWKQDVTL